MKLLKQILLWAFLFVPVLARATPSEELVQAMLIADTSTLQPGQPFHLGVLFTIKPDWHIYWKNAGDTGLPTAVRFELPEGFVASDLQWPAPIGFEQPGNNTVAYGYRTGLLLLATITPPARLPAEAVTFGAHATWLACEKSCVPGNAQLELKLPAASTTRPINSQVFKLWQSRVPVALTEAGPAVVRVEGALAGDNAPAPFAIHIEWKAPVTDIGWFPDVDGSLYLDQITSSSKNTSTRISFTARQLKTETPGPQTMQSVLAYTIAGGERKAVVVRIPLGTTAPSTRPATRPVD